MREARRQDSRGLREVSTVTAVPVKGQQRGGSEMAGLGSDLGGWVLRGPGEDLAFPAQASSFLAGS